MDGSQNAEAGSSAAMTVEEAITGRRSIRAFLDKPVPRELIERLMRIAGRAPSGSNIQPWRVWVVTGAKKDALCKDVLALHYAGVPARKEFDYYPANWREPYLARRRACGWGLYNLLGIERGDKQKMLDQHGRNYAFFDAPVGLLFTMDRDMVVGTWLDYGMFLQSIMIGARGLGLETCPQAAWASYPDIVQKHTGMPDDQMVICGMSLGYADWSVPVNDYVTEREAIEAFTTFVGND